MKIYAAIPNPKDSDEDDEEEDDDDEEEENEEEHREGDSGGSKNQLKRRNYFSSDEDSDEESDEDNEEEENEEESDDDSADDSDNDDEEEDDWIHLSGEDEDEAGDEAMEEDEEEVIEILDYHMEEDGRLKNIARGKNKAISNQKKRTRTRVVTGGNKKQRGERNSRKHVAKDSECEEESMSEDEDLEADDFSVNSNDSCGTIAEDYDFDAFESPADNKKAITVAKLFAGKVWHGHIERQQSASKSHNAGQLFLVTYENVKKRLRNKSQLRKGLHMAKWYSGFTTCDPLVQQKTKVAKYFDSVLYWGKVEMVSETDGTNETDLAEEVMAENMKKYYKIKYEDGDWEDWEENELQVGLELAKKG